MLEDVKKALEELGKPELFDSIVEIVNSEKQRGIEEKSKANREAQNLRKFKKALESIGYSDDTDLEDFTSDILNKTKSTKESESLTMKALNQKIQDLENQINAERTTVKQTKIMQRLTEALSDKVYGSQYLIKSLLTDGKVDIDGDNIVFKDGENVYDFQTGINRVLEQNKEIVRTNQAQGTGSKIQDNKPKDVQSILDSKDPALIRENLGEIAKELGLKI